jgi:hypothetical protein
MGFRISSDRLLARAAQRQWSSGRSAEGVQQGPLCHQGRCGASHQSAEVQMARRLNYLDMLLVDDMLDVIIAACVLHNFVLQQAK